MRWRNILWIGPTAVFGLIIALYILLSTYDYNSLKPRIERAVRDATGRDLVLGGDISLRLGFSPALVVENLAFRNASWGSRPDMMYLKRLEIRVGLLPLILGHVYIRRFVLIEPDILIETDKSGRSNLSFESAKEPKKGTSSTEPLPETRLKVPVLSVAEVKIEHGRVTYRESRTGKTYPVNIDTMTANAAGAESPVQLKLKGSWKEKDFEIAGTLGSWSALASGRAFPVNLVITAAESRLAVDGNIKDMLTLRGMDVLMEAKGRDIGNFNSFVGEPLPLKGPFEITARLTDPALKKYRVSDLTMVLGDSDLSGSGEADLSGERPAMTATLLFKKWDLRPLLKDSKGKGAKAGKTAGQNERREKVFSDLPLPLQGLDKADVTLRLQGQKILLPDVAIDALKAETTLKAGHLVIKPLEAAVGGGTLNGSLSLETQGTSAAMKMELKVKQLDVGRMMQELGKGQPVQGHLDVSMDVYGKGRSEAELMSGLNGRAVLAMSKGQIQNGYIELLGGDLSSSIFPLLNPFQRETEYTVLNCFVGGFNIRNGLAKTTAFVADTTRMSVIGEGEVNLKTEELDLSMKPVPKEGIATGVAGKVSLSLSELARPFKLSGTLAHPSLGIDTGRAAETIAKAVGGIVLFGPAGLAATLVRGGSGEGDLCRVALEAAEKGVPLSVVEKQEKKPGVLGQAGEALGEGLDKVGKKLKELFGK